MDPLEKTMTDDVNQPEHYTIAKGFEVIDVIEGYSLDYHLGNVIKYVLRHNYKGKPLQDLKKAQWYLNRYIEQYGKEFCEVECLLDYGAQPTDDFPRKYGNGAEACCVYANTNRCCQEYDDHVVPNHHNGDPEHDGIVDVCDWCGGAIEKGQTYLAHYERPDKPASDVWCCERCREEDLSFSVGGTE